MSTDNAVYSLRQKQRQERLELILQAAEQVFTEKGYHNTSMDEIAARVGIGTATIYSHFSSKEDLMVVAILQRDFQKIVKRVEEICGQEESATEKLRSIFHLLSTCEFFSRRVQLFYAMGSTPEAQKAMLFRQETMMESSHAFSRALATMIDQGKASGEFRQDITTPAMLKGLIGLVRVQSVPDQFINHYDSAEEELLDIYLQGIRRCES